jgi:hypothetical protein
MEDRCELAELYVSQCDYHRQDGGQVSVGMRFLPVGQVDLYPRVLEVEFAGLSPAVAPTRSCGQRLRARA